MKNKPKLNNKEIISFLVKHFPCCFFLKGKIRPLKIGIFQDIVNYLTEEDCISKTQLRSALHMYTYNIRYFYAIKKGTKRIDLNGRDCGELEAKHITYANQELIKLKNNIRSKGFKKKNIIYKIYKSDAKKNIYNKFLSLKHKENNIKNNKKNTNINTIKIGQSLMVKIGNSIVNAFVLEISKDFIKVQLSTGLAVIVRSEHLIF